MGVPADPEIAERLFSAVGVPDLRHVGLFSNTNPLPEPFLRALITSPLVAQLTSLQLTQGALDSTGAAVVEELSDHLSHIEALTLVTPRV